MASATSRSAANAGTCLPEESGSRPGPRGRVAPGRGEANCERLSSGSALPSQLEARERSNDTLTTRVVLVGDLRLRCLACR